MKKLILLASMCLLVHSSLYAQQVPNVISYQGFISNNGKPADSGMYAITVALYSDSAGSACVWRDTYWTPVTNGVFNLSIGSHVPLPNAPNMDRPLWLGVSVNGSAELRPLSQLSSTPYAMNVADSSITAQKMATDYVSGISIDGTKITNRGGALNLSSEGVVKFQFDSSSNSVFANLPIASVPNSSVYWSESGNNSTTPGLNYVGTSDSVALEIHVNDGGDTTAGNGRVMRYEPMPTSPNIIGGYRGNVMSTTNGGSVIAGGGSSIYPNTINGDFSVIGGGAGNTAINGGSVAGGAQNTAGIEAFIGGGAQDSAGYLAVVSGGLTNTARSEGSVVSGGTLNKAFGADATVAGGATNTANGPYDAIGGGTQNIAYDSGSVIAGGVNNSAQFEGAVGGGLDNQADTLSAIPGGARLSLGKYSFGFNAGSAATTIPDDNVAYFGNVDLEIASPDGIPRQLRIFSTYGPYTSFQAASSGSGMDIHYTLPGFQGLAGSVLTNDGTGQLSWDTIPAERDTNAWLLKGNYGTIPPMNFIGTLDSQAFEIHLFDTAAATGGNKRVMRYELGQTSPNIIGGSSANTLGAGLSGAAVLSGGSITNPNVVNDSFSIIAGGDDNKIDTDADHAFIGSGRQNYINGLFSVIGGGEDNIIAADSADHNVITGGLGNIELDPSFGVIAGGAFNYLGWDSWSSSIGGGWYDSIFTNWATIGGGANNFIDGYCTGSTIGGGDSNRIGAAGYAFIGGGFHNKSWGDYTTIGGGYKDSTFGLYSFLGGGQLNKIDFNSTYSTLAGGYENYIGSAYGFIGGGNDNLIQDTGAVIVGGMSNSILLTYSAYPSGRNCFIGSGTQNQIDGHGRDSSEHEYAYNTAIVAGQNNTAREENSFIGAGRNNTINDGEAFIGAGDSNYVNWGYSGVVTGSQDSIKAAYFSLIGAGTGNIINSSIYAFIGAGSSNYINNGEAFIGAGQQDSIFASASGIGSGYQNMTGSGADYSFVGGGSNDSARAFSSFIGAGNANATDMVGYAGKFASIPGGQGLRTQSYAQTAMGFYNARAGSTTFYTDALTTAHMDDPLVIVGNGLPDSSASEFIHDSLVSVTIHRGSDAALISNRGHLLVFDSLGNAPAGRLDPIQGGAYKDNMINAWGDVQGADTGMYPQHYAATNNFGDVLGTAITHTTANSGVYVVTIQCFNSDGSHRILTAAAINVTVQQGIGESCGYATVSKIGGNQFTVHTYNAANPADPGACNAADRSFFFTVVGR